MGVTEQPQGSLGVTTILDVTGTPGLGDGRVGSGRAQLGQRSSSESPGHRQRLTRHSHIRHSTTP